VISEHLRYDFCKRNTRLIIIIAYTIAKKLKKWKKKKKLNQTERQITITDITMVVAVI